MDGVTNAGQGVIDAQIALLTALSQPFVTAGNRFVDVNRELLGIVSINSHYLNFGLVLWNQVLILIFQASNAGNRFGETGQNVGRLVNEGFQPFVQTGNNLFELGSDTLEAPLQSVSFIFVFITPCAKI